LRFAGQGYEISYSKGFILNNSYASLRREPWLVVGWPIMYSFAVPLVACSYPLLVFS
jgi:hypothetical protein